MSKLVTDSLRNEFRDNGVVFIGGALDRDTMRMAEDAYKWSLAHPSPGAGKFQGKEDAAAIFYQDLANPKALPAYRAMLEKSPIADIAADLWVAPDVWFMYEQVFLKEGGESRRTPWHQDSSYLAVDGDDLAVAWISFDAVAQADSLEFVRGSHRGVLYNGSSFALDDDTAPLHAGDALPRLPDIEAERARFDIVAYGVEPGDVVLFHPKMLHGGAPTHPGGRRRTLTLRYFGRDCRYDARPGPAGPRLSPGHGLKNGDLLRDPSFLKLA